MLNAQLDFLKLKLIEYLNTLEINTQHCNSSIAANLEKIIHEEEKEGYKNSQEDIVFTLNFNYTSVLKIYTKEHSAIFPLHSG